MATKFCPMTREACWEHKCEWYVQIMGNHPQTGEPLSQFDCSVKWLPMLIIESAQQARQAGAATESFRNEFVKRSDTALALQHMSLDDMRRKIVEVPLAPSLDQLPPGDA